MKPLTQADCLIQLRKCINLLDEREKLSRAEREKLDYKLQFFRAFIELSNTDSASNAFVYGFQSDEDEDEEDEDEEDEA